MPRKKGVSEVFTSVQTSDAISSIQSRANRKNTPPTGLETQGVLPKALRIRCEYHRHLPPNLRSAADATEAERLAELLSIARQRSGRTMKRLAGKLIDPAGGTRGCGC